MKEAGIFQRLQRQSLNPKASCQDEIRISLGLKKLILLFTIFIGGSLAAASALFLEFIFIAKVKRNRKWIDDLEIQEALLRLQNYLLKNENIRENVTKSTIKDLCFPSIKR